MPWQCSWCGGEHAALPFDWIYEEPDYWDGGRSGDDHLAENYCTWTDDSDVLCHFVRGLIEIPILGSTDVFAYGAWASVSKESFDRVHELWDVEPPVDEPGFFGWLSSSLPGYAETLNLPLDVVMRGRGTRPAFVLRDADHDLVREQREGITIDRVREIAELHMHGALA
jgi:hypothetical protein